MIQKKGIKELIQNEENNLNINAITTAAWASGGAGTQTAGLIFGATSTNGTTIPGVKLSESYNGTSWTTVNSLNTGRGAISGAGTQTVTASVLTTS